jgi:hypothetical protein
MRFSQGRDVENHLIQKDTGEEKSIVVLVVGLDDYCRQNEIKHIDYLKVAVEGADKRTLR